ncbi:YidC/Oxa1 family membrane protein insertase [Massilia consociata]|uniref:YidC/Oxa1 family membrane protein insertase n=1 Tax=Massilia consociata TaxID=760117 RepID=A0ABV6FJY1_9BURK
MTQLATLFGGNMGWTILALALMVRLALFPLTLHLARRMLSNQKKIKALQPQVDAIRARHAADPKAMFAAISALYKENGARMFDRSSLLGALVQLPVFGLLYRAITTASTGAFLWMRNLASPDVVLTGIVLLLTAIATYYSPSMAADMAMVMMIVQVAVTAFILWKVAAGVGLYWAVSACASIVQNVVLHVEERRLARITPA